jgi:hypothetical protein
MSRGLRFAALIAKAIYTEGRNPPGSSPAAGVGFEFEGVAGQDGEPSSRAPGVTRRAVSDVT